MPGARVVATSARTGAGLDELRAALAAVRRAAHAHGADGPARLHVDRSFSLRGIGTVATGTLWSGTIGEGDELRVEPRGRSVRVRSVQVHDRPVERAEAGQRVAVALPGVERQEVRRGDVLVTPGAFARASGSTSHSSRWTRSRRGSCSTTAPRRPRLGWRAPATASPSCGCRGRSSPRAATASSCARGRRSAAESSSIPRRRATPTSRGSRRSSAARRSCTLPRWWTGSGAGRRSGSRSCAPSWTARSTPPIRSTRAFLFRRPRGRGRSSRTSGSSCAARSSTGRAPTPELGERDGGGGRAQATARPRAGAGGGRRSLRASSRSRAGSCESATASRSRRDAVRAGAWRPVDGITLAQFRDALGVGRKTAQLYLERFDADGVTRRVGDARVLRRKR